MRVGLVSPYSYTYPGGVGRHVEALAEELLDPGPRCAPARALRPRRPPGTCIHRGARRSSGPCPITWCPLGRTVGHRRSNGAVSNLSLSTQSVGDPRPRAAQRRLRRRPRARAQRAVRQLVRRRGAPRARWSPPSTPTRTTRFSNGLAANVCGARRLYSKLTCAIAVSEAAALDRASASTAAATGSIPNGVDLAAAPADRAPGRRPAASCCSSAAPRSARACRCCCARSRRCAAPASTPG